MYPRASVKAPGSVFGLDSEIVNGSCATTTVSVFSGSQLRMVSTCSLVVSANDRFLACVTASLTKLLSLAAFFQSPALIADCNWSVSARSLSLLLGSCAASIMVDSRHTMTRRINDNPRTQANNQRNGSGNHPCHEGWISDARCLLGPGPPGIRVRPCF